MYFAPGTFGSMTTERVTVPQELTASTSAAAPAASANPCHRPAMSVQMPRLCSASRSFSVSSTHLWRRGPGRGGSNFLSDLWKVIILLFQRLVNPVVRRLHQIHGIVRIVDAQNAIM